MFRKQLCIWVLFSFCILSACGCSKQDSNSEVMEELVGENEEYDGIGIPTSYSGNLEIGEKELRINCQTISVPENMSMFCKEYKNKSIDNNFKKRILNYLFPDSDIYVYMEGYTEPEKKEMYTYYFSLKELAIENGDTLIADYYDLYCEEYGAGTECIRRDKVESDYDENKYISRKDGIDYVVEFVFDNEEYKGMKMYYLHDELAINSKPYKDYKIVKMEGNYGDNENAGLMDSNNICSLSKEEAEKIATDFLAEAGISDASVLENQGLAWQYEKDGDYGIIEMEYLIDGYSITYSKSIAGVRASVWYDDCIDNQKTGEAKSKNMNKLCTVFVDDTGIIGFNIYDSFVETESALKKTNLISWNELIGKMEQNGADYFAGEYSSYKSLEVNYVRLTYDIVQNDVGIYMKPVWEFMRFDEKDLESEYYMYPEIVICVDAESGDYIKNDEIVN